MSPLSLVRRRHKVNISAPFVDLSESRFTFAGLLAMHEECPRYGPVTVRTKVHAECAGRPRHHELERWMAAFSITEAVATARHGSLHPGKPPRDHPELAETPESPLVPGRARGWLGVANGDRQFALNR